MSASAMVASPVEPRSPQGHCWSRLLPRRPLESRSTEQFRKVA